MEVLARGALHKMRTELKHPISYSLSLQDTDIHLNDYLGKAIAIEYLGSINCCNCGRLTKKS